jgi:hypothetical protein
VTCGTCGGDFELSARNIRAARAEGRQPKCRRCRYGHKPPKVTQGLRDYWTSRYTHAELVELAAGLWPQGSLVGSVDSETAPGQHGTLKRDLRVTADLSNHAGSEERREG